ncbi:putative peptidoglycan glycosyltransferase FtsW [Amnibacterium sp. CER49]|uniref:FtsW/RodA/SpoVE family cell cycle protein n=1 Tax=Amnibacterium sp. CER49 TaxID=3039161 RepID=UPI002449C729|nr:putative peptidoglycan glycosyltransferase FtsW [Amnibacterium sp. CER49]MDH2444705.1 putative peptidoglycan glycosyltransferase FtsW [Amnibacterium sp. CER49]
METETAVQRTADVIPLFVRRRMRTVRVALPPLSRVGTPDYYALGAITLFLAAFGLLMVLSASSVEQSQRVGNPYADFGRQAIAESLGVALMLLVSRLKPAVLLRSAPIVFAGAVVVQLLTVLTPLGLTVNGNRNWIRIAGFTLQPSEFVKLGLVLLIAAVLSRRKAERLGFVGLLPVLLPAALAILVVLLGKDLGTSMIIGLIVLAGLYFSGVRIATLGSLTVLAALVFGLAAASRGSRVDRLAAWSHGCNGDVLGTCWQAQQAIWALANGGLFGVGIGNSVSKWFWLPEADNDFILAVIGEETGLVGLLVLLLLFVALAVVALRIVTASRDRFTRAAVGMALAWLVGQAFANIAVVLGLAPVFGVPLPFVSAGGSSMIANLLAVGAVMALANASKDGRAPSAPPLRHRPAPVRGGSA